MLGDFRLLCRQLGLSFQELLAQELLLLVVQELGGLLGLRIRLLLCKSSCRRRCCCCGCRCCCCLRRARLVCLCALSVLEEAHRFCSLRVGRVATLLEARDLRFSIRH